MDFTFDTSGDVIVNQTRIRFPDLYPLMRGYVRAAFESAWKPLQDHGPLWLREPTRWRHTGFSDLAPATLAAMMADCEKALNSKLWGNSDGDGRLFWVERQDGFSTFEGDQRVDLQRLFPPLTLTIRDGLVYQEASR